MTREYERMPKAAVSKTNLSQEFHFCQTVYLH